MGLPLKSAHFKRYRDIAYLLIKYGQVDMAKTDGPGDLLWGHGEGGTGGNGTGGAGSKETAAGIGTLPKTAGKPLASELAADLEKLGPTFIRLGQLLAKRTDLLPPEYTEALSRVGQQIEPLPVAQVRKIIEAEIGSPAGELFERFDSIPLSASILEQTHSARLKDGRPVIVKIQRPGLEQEIGDDLQALDEVVRFYDHYLRTERRFNLRSSFEEFRDIVAAELDYRREAHNLRALRENLKELHQIVVPTPIEKYSRSRVLTIDFIEGEKLTAATVTRLGRWQRARLAEQVFYAYLKQFLVDGFVDANPDAADLLLTADGKLAILDLGVVARISPSAQEQLIQLLLSVCEGRAEHAAELLLSMGERLEGFQEAAFRHGVAELVMAHRDLTIERFELGRIFQGIARKSIACGVALPTAVPMLGTALLKLEQVAHMLDPEFDSNAFVNRSLSQMMQQHICNTLSPSHLFHTIVEAAEFLEKLPGKVGKILDAVASNDLAVTIHAIDEQVLISGFRKIANRITVGLILAALIIGAAIMMHVPSPFTIFGYPGLAILCFVLAAVCGFGLVLEILISDLALKK